MAIFKISEEKIKTLKQRHLFLIIPTIVITSIICQTFIFHAIQDIKVFFISLSMYLVIVSLLIMFIIKYVIKSNEKSLKSIQYIVENNHLIISQNNIEQYNIAKDDIKFISKYKNNLLVITINNNKKIFVNKYLENYDELIIHLKQLSEINEMDKNPYIFQNIIAGIAGILVMATFFLSNNLILVIISSVLLFTFCMYLFITGIKNKSLDPKRRKMLYFIPPGALFFIIEQIMRRF